MRTLRWQRSVPISDYSLSGRTKERGRIWAPQRNSGTAKFSSTFRSLLNYIYYVRRCTVSFLSVSDLGTSEDIVFEMSLVPGIGALSATEFLSNPYTIGPQYHYASSHVRTSHENWLPRTDISSALIIL